MYSYLVCFSTIARYITPGLGEVKETFQENHNNNVAADIGDLPTFLYEDQKNSFFYTMSEYDRIMYCNKAKDIAGLDAITPITSTQLKSLYEEVIVECRTLPISYLRISFEKIQILMWENTFFEYHYEVQMTNSEPIIYSKSTRPTETKNTKIKVANLLEAFRSASFDNDRLEEVYVSENMSIADFLNIIGSTSFENYSIKDNSLSRLEKDEPIKVCIAAKRHLRLLAGKDDDAHKVPVLQNDRVELAQIFDFGNEIGEHVALPCPSIPPMYVYFKDPTDHYSRDLQIVLVQI